MRKITTPKGAGAGKQLTLTSFFSKSPASQNSVVSPKTQSSTTNKDDLEDAEKNSNKIKRIKLDDMLTKVTDAEGNAENEIETKNKEHLSSPSSMTPMEKQRMEEKALDARLIRASKLLQIIDPKMERSWFKALEQEFKKDYFTKLSNFVVSERGKATIFPPLDNVWEWAKQGSIQNIKVVILGQDPYHQPNQAHGLCFSVKKGVPPPPSLVNMYKELANDIPGFEIPKHGCLSGWCEQGVLLLNAVLTVERNKPNSHKDQGWERLTDAVISWISNNLDSVVFLLWGSYAQKKAAFVNKNKHHLLMGPHPSPLSAHRGFFGCKHFSRCNELLMKNKKTPINWNHLP